MLIHCIYVRYIAQQLYKQWPNQRKACEDEAVNNEQLLISEYYYYKLMTFDL